MAEIEANSGVNRPQEPLGVLPPGTRLRGYELVSVLGQGGFGITYLARDSTLHRDVAIKEYLPVSLALRHEGLTVLPRSTEQAADFVWGRDRFLDEARTLARLEGAPAVVRVIDFLEANGTAYMVMALARGETLDRRLRERGPLAATDIERLLPPILDGLEQVHEAGFLHRDIKPANIILDARSNPTLIDFGASRAAMAGRSVAMTAIFTPGYAAAEQFTSAKQGPWTDIYGLSATLYNAITGKAPPSAFDRMLEDNYEPLQTLSPAGYRTGLLAGIDAGLAVRANDRPADIASWRAVLQRTGSAMADSEVTQVVRSAPQPAPSSAAPRARAAVPNRRRAVWAAAAVAALLVAGAGTYLLSSGGFKPAQTMTAAELEQALAERRKADSLAEEKKKLEEEAQRRAAADAEAKRQADSELEKARQQRQKAGEELAKLKAEMEARQKTNTELREQAAAAAKRAEEEASGQRKAEAEIAALRQAADETKKKAAAEAEAKQLADEQAQRKIEEQAAALRKAEEEAQKKAAVEAEAKRKADEQLAKAQAEREKAEADAKAKAEAETKAKAEADAKVKAEAEKKAEAEVRKQAEAAEVALKLTTQDRQRLQVALTAQNFDTRGTDGAFGPRSREMVAAWQKARNLPATGFLDARQQQALLKESASAVGKYDDEQKKIEDDKKKAEEEAKKKAEEEAKKKAEEEAKAKAAAAQGASSPSPAAPSASGLGKYDGKWGGAVGSWAISLNLADGKGTLSLTCRMTGIPNNIPVTLAPDGSFTTNITPSGLVARRTVTLRMPNITISPEIQCPGGNGTLVLGAAMPNSSASPATPTSQQYDGTWTGAFGVWKVSLEVSNGKGSLVLACQTVGTPAKLSVDVAPDGSFTAFMSTFGTNSRRAVTVKLPIITISPEVNCPGGSGTLSLDKKP